VATRRVPLSHTASAWIRVRVESCPVERLAVDHRR
jgi:hypothetical protein